MRVLALTLICLINMGPSFAGGGGYDPGDFRPKDGNPHALYLCTNELRVNETVWLIFPSKGKPYISVHTSDEEGKYSPVKYSVRSYNKNCKAESLEITRSNNYTYEVSAFKGNITCGRASSRNTRTDFKVSVDLESGFGSVELEKSGWQTEFRYMELRDCQRVR